MTAPFKTWKVLPHGRLTPIDDGLLTVSGQIPLPIGDFPRRMTVVRLDDGRLVIWSAVALDEDEMAELEQFGRPAFLIVPNDHHRQDAAIWKDRYPDIQVIAPSGAREHVEDVVPVDATWADFGDPWITLVEVPGTCGREAALEITRADGLTLVVNDLVANIHGKKGFSGWLLKLMGFAGDEPHVPGPIKPTLVKDRAALAAQLRRWASEPLLKRIVVSHGDIIEDDPQGVLRTLAERLD